MDRDNVPTTPSILPHRPPSFSNPHRLPAKTANVVADPSDPGGGHADLEKEEGEHSRNENEFDDDDNDNDKGTIKQQQLQHLVVQV